MKIRKIHYSHRDPYWYEMRLQLLITKALDRDDEEYRLNPVQGESTVYDPEIGEELSLSEYNKRTGSNFKEYNYDLQN